MTTMVKVVTAEDIRTGDFSGIEEAIRNGKQIVCVKAEVKNQEDEDGEKTPAHRFASDKEKWDASIARHANDGDGKTAAE